MFRVVALIVICVPLLASADPKAAAKRVAPLINDQTFVFVRIDLKNAQVEPFLKLLAPAFPEPEMHKRMISEVVQMQEIYVEQKCDELVILYGMEDAGEEPVLIPPTSFVRNLTPKLSLDFPESQVVGGNRLLGRKRSIDRYLNRKPSPRPDLTAAVAGFGDGVVQIVLFPGKDSRRTVNEMLPQLPREIGGGPSNVLTNGFSWASLEIGGKSPYPLKLTIQCTNDAAATKLLEVIQKGTEFVKSLPMEATGLDRVSFGLLVQELAVWGLPKRTGSRLVLEQNLETRIVELGKQMPKPDPAATNRRFAQNNMKQIGLALHNYHDSNGRFPTNILDAKGKAILSWRVELLPYLEQNVLYRQIDRKLAWDDPMHKDLRETNIRTFMSTPNDGKSMPGKTRFLASKSKDGIFYAGKNGIFITDISDGTSNTVFFVQVAEDQAKHWMEPDDWEPNATDILKGVVDEKLGGFNASFVDGSVRFIKKDFGAKWLKALITRAGGEVVPFE